MISILNIKRKEIEKCIFLHGLSFSFQVVQNLKDLLLKHGYVSFRFALIPQSLSNTSNIECFCFRLAGADRGEEYGYKSGGKVQTVAWLHD